ncbi:hypothetical protein HY932_03105 [Candidatus Falkowbacteria bacterium]|nr:hypothetical protein [Candidatus Falkowbacteria bacterium]
MDNLFQNYSMQTSLGTKADAGFAIVPADEKVGLTGNIFGIIVNILI